MTRKYILERAVEECLDEMYRKSQPSITWEEVLKGHKEGKYSENNTVIDQHYLSQDEYTDIKERYMHMYNIHNDWKDSADLMIEYLEKGGTKDKYIPAVTDETGYHPGYRGYEKTPKLIDALKEFLSEEDAQKATEKVFELMNDCKNFYRGDAEESSFSFTLMNYSPNSCKDKVQEFWGDKVKIYDRRMDPEVGEFVDVTDAKLDEWENSLEWAEENKEAYLIEAYTELLQEYGRIKDNSNS